MLFRFLFFTLAALALASAQTFAAPFTGELDRSFNPTLGRVDLVRVRAIAPQPDGKFIIAGTFLKINGQQVNSVARFNADGTLDPTFDAAGTVFGVTTVLALQPDGKVIVGGSFDSVSRQLRRRIARLNADGSFDPTFAPPVQAAAGNLVAAAVQADGKVLVYGASLFAGRDVARLNPDGSIDTTFAANPAPINSIAVQTDGKILIGFSGSATISGQTRTGAARLNADGSLDTSFPNLNASSTVFKIVALSNGKIMLGGLFSSLSGQQYQRLARLNADGSIDASFANNPNRVVSVREIAVQSDGKVVYSGLDSPIYRDNADGTSDANFVTRSRIYSEVDVVAALPDDRIVVGGRTIVSTVTPPSPSFTRDQPMALLAADGTLNESVNHDIAYSSGLSPVDIVVQPDGKILFAEDYEQALPSPIFRRIVRFNPNGSPDPTFSFGTIPTNIVGTGALISQIARQSDGKIIFGTSSNTSSTRNVFRVNADGSFDSAFNVTFAGGNGDIFRIEVLADDDILVYGNFTQLNGQARAGFARLNSDGSLDSFNPNLTAQAGNGTPVINGFVVQPDGKYYLSGNFVGADGQATNYVARYNLNGAVDTSFATSFTFFSNQFSLLTAQPDGKLILGSLGSLLRLNPNGSVDESFTRVTFRTATVQGVTPIQAAVLPNGKILIGGAFTSTSDFSVARSGFARLNADGTLDLSYGNNGGTSGSSNTVFKIEVQADGKALIAGRFQYVNNISQFTIARLNTSAVTPGSIVSDFDGDGRTDTAVFRSGTWYINPSSAASLTETVAPAAFYAVQFGLATDKLTPADFDGDGKTDVAVWREAPATQAAFYILNSSNNTFRTENFGQTGDNPIVVGDWDGDAKADPAVYRNAAFGNQSYFFYRGSLNNPSGGTTFLPFGTNGDLPARGDFDGDAKMDLAVFRPSERNWYIRHSSNNSLFVQQFGLTDDKRVSGDFDGDGRTDLAVFRPSSGTWFVRQSSDAQLKSQQWGLSNDSLTPGDYDGDGKTDFAVWRPADGNFYVLQSSNAQFTARKFGASGDTPVAAAFVQ